jgi:hypothetical protein
MSWRKEEDIMLNRLIWLLPEVMAWKGSHMYSIQYIQAQAVLMGIL